MALMTDFGRLLKSKKCLSTGKIDFICTYLFSLPTSTEAVKKKKKLPQMYEKEYRDSVQVIMISSLSSETPMEKSKQITERPESP